jgi:hypothetical protein
VIPAGQQLPPPSDCSRRPSCAYGRTLLGTRFNVRCFSAFL